MSDPLTSTERQWLDHFRLACAGDYNTLTWHIPPRIRAHMAAAIQHDDWARQLDLQRAHLTGELADLILP